MPSPSKPAETNPFSQRITMLASEPTTVRPSGFPACPSDSHTRTPSRAGTLTSKLSSPVYPARATRAGAPATVVSRIVMKGKASGARFVPTPAVSRTSLAFGPHTQMLVH